MEPIIVWIMVAIYTGKQGVGAELSPGMYDSEKSCREDLATVKSFMDQQGVITAYGLECVKVIVKETPKNIPKGMGKQTKA